MRPMSMRQLRPGPLIAAILVVDLIIAAILWLR